MKISTIQRCFTDFEGRAPSESELDFLDKFIKSRERLASAHSATSVSTNDVEVAKTLKDLMEKRARLYPDYSRPCTFEEAFLMSGEVTSVGKTQRFSMANHKLFSAESDLLAKLNALLNGFAPKACQSGICVAENQYLPIKAKEIRSSKRYAVTIAYSANEDGLLSFAKKISTSKYSLNRFVSNGSEVFCKICEYSRSLTIDADVLPSFDGYAVVVFSKPKKAKKIISLAKKCNIEVCSAIKISKDNRLKVIKEEKEAFSFRSLILRGAMGASSKDIKITDQFPTKETLSAEKICELPESNERVYMTNVLLNDELSFSQSMSAIISPLVAAAYDGLNTLNSEFSLSINASLPEESDRAFAALLGLYRAASELGITIESPHLSITKSSGTLAVALRVHSFKEKNLFSTPLSQDELIKMLVGEKLVPDFETLRSIINGKNA